MCLLSLWSASRAAQYSHAHAADTTVTSHNDPATVSSPMSSELAYLFLVPGRQAVRPWGVLAASPSAWGDSLGSGGLAQRWWRPILPVPRWVGADQGEQLPTLGLRSGSGCRRCRRIRRWSPG